MHSQVNGFMYTLMEGDYFEPLSTYEPSRELIEIVENLGGEGSVTAPGGMWAYFVAHDYELPTQGWKIHVSAHPGTAPAVLQRLAPVLVRGKVAFKFASDLQMVGLMTNKNWPRTGSGKFITIYPRDTRHFKDVIETCYESMQDFQGPHIFTDRPYRDSKSVFYRYGGFRPVNFQTPYGETIPALQDPEGRLVADERKPFFAPPPWARDPFPADPEEAPSGPITLNGRYRVEKAIRFSNRGGVYRAVDTLTGQGVIVKEARPGVDANFEGRDSRDTLRQEAKILRKLEHTGLAPRFVDLFQEWDHLFLVEEELDGETFFGFALNRTLGFTHYKETDRRAYYRGIVELAEKLADALETLHGQRVVLRDLTKDNVMILPDGQLRLIDFEMSFDLDSDLLVQGHTRGYASPQQLRNELPTVEEDYYALGALLFEYLFFSTTLLHLDPGAVDRFLEEFLRDTELPRELAEAVRGLMHPEVEQRWSPRRALEHLRRGESTIEGGRFFREKRSPGLRGRIAHTLEGVTRYLEATADFEREDRLWPTNPRVYATNPVNVQYGACGTAWFLLRSRGRVPERVLDWIEARLEDDPLPPGLYNGQAGVAWFLWEAGRHETALRLLAESARHPSLSQLDDLMYGAAGWGLAALHFWKETGDAEYLAWAERTGRDLLARAELSEAGLSWSAEKDTYLGVAHGSSGIGLFLLYLHAAGGGPEYRDAALRAMDFDLHHAIRVDDKLWWRRTVASDDPAKFPHWRLGSAGVGMALLRAHHLTGEQHLREEAVKCINACDSKWANKIWQNFGLAGYGELLLDAYRFLGDESYLENALRIAQGILLFRLERPEGIAFPGIELLRISADYGTGMAGTALFLDRLSNPERGRLLLPDGLLEQPGRRAESSELVTA